MSKKFLVRGIAGLAVAGLLAAPAAAGAATGTAGLDTIKQAAHTAIENRLTALNAAIAVVNGSSFMESDQGVIKGELQADVSGLTALDQKIQSDTTTEQAKADAQTIFTDYRVFALMLPVAHMTRASDAIVHVVAPHLDNVAAKLQDAITKKGATSLQATLDDMKAQIAAAVKLASPLPTRLEVLKPADWNANHEVLQPDRSALEQARTDLKKARSDAAAIITGLRK
jgi:hypothetical protein